MLIDKTDYMYDNYNEYERSFKLILDITANVYSNTFENLNTSTLPLKFDYSPDSPHINADRTCIYLNCDISYFCQVAYQLCHELCHISIKRDVVPAIRWLEESICECASLYFVPIIAYEWFKITQNRNYYIKFIKYINSTISDESNITKFDISSLFNKKSDTLFYLRNHEYNRKMNRYIAIKLLPIFNEYPVLWKSFQNLYKVSQGDTLNDVLSELKSYSHVDSYQAIDKIVYFAKSDSFIHL